MAAIPAQEDGVAVAIYRVHERRAGPARTYLGGSTIGEACERKLWYSFIGATRVRHEGRLLRLFATGHREEERVIDELRAAGMQVWCRDERGEQLGGAILGGHVRYHVDGVVTGVPGAEKTPHLLEVKTHNAKSFAALAKGGVKASKPVHYAQMQFYMGQLGLERALYVAVCKDTDEVYSERVSFDETVHAVLLAKAERIVKASNPPARCTEDPAWYECKFCEHRKVCWGEAMPRRDCRTCSLATCDTESDGGIWHCSRWDANVPRDALAQACDDHVYAPQLVPGFTAEDAGTDDRPWLLFKRGDVEFINGNPEHVGDEATVLTSEQLQDIDPRALDRKLLDTLRGMTAGMSVIQEEDVPF